MSFLSDIYSVLNGETSKDTNTYIIETTDPRSTVEDVRLYEPQRVSYTPSSSETIIANAIVDLAGTRWDKKTDVNIAITEAVNTYMKNPHTESSWKTFGRLVELAHKKFNFDMQESLKKYNQDQIDLLDMKEAVNIDVDIRAGLGGDPKLADVEIEVIDFDGPDQPQDIWKGEIKRDDEEKQTKTESAEIDESKMSELNAMIKDGKSAKEIAKEMKLDEKTISELMKGMKEIKEEDLLEMWINNEVEIDEELEEEISNLYDRFEANEITQEQLEEGIGSLLKKGVKKVGSSLKKGAKKAGSAAKAGATKAKKRLSVSGRQAAADKKLIKVKAKKKLRDTKKEIKRIRKEEDEVVESKLQKLQKLNIPKEG